MPKRTSPRDAHLIGRAEDVSRVVRDKRGEKRANKQKATQRNRRYENRLLRHLRAYGEED